MTSETELIKIEQRISQNALELFANRESALHKKIDSIYIKIALIQWIAGIIIALVVSPRTWSGETSNIHIHVLSAVFLGGAIIAYPIYMALKHSGKTFTRHTVAIGQICFSALLIHLTGGRIETHFHVFASLAFLMLYRDWRVLITGTVAVALDHVLRGTFYPESIYGILSINPWRWIEHAGWVLTEVASLVFTCVVSLNEMHQICNRQARLETMNEKINLEVKLQTEKLEQANINTVNLNESLQNRLNEIEEQKKLGKISINNAYDSGKAEMATNTLHNIGNILNSVNVSANILMQNFENSTIKSLHKASEILNKHTNNLVEFFTNDPKSTQIIKYLLESEKCLTLEMGHNKDEISKLSEKIDLIKQAVEVQQSYAKSTCRVDLLEKISLTEMTDQILILKKHTLQAHQINIVKKYNNQPFILINKSKIFNIIFNLIKNARESLDEYSGNQKILTIEINKTQDGNPFIKISDNGLGIKEENLHKLFTHGFTTKEYGHGFGLHFCALTLKEYQATILATSEGLNKGSQFTITFLKEELMLQDKIENLSCKDSLNEI